MKLDPVFLAGVQKFINEQTNQKLYPDGAWGPKSSAALKPLQTKFKIPVTGLLDDVTLSVISVPVVAKYLNFQALEAAATKLTITLAHVRTVCEIESAGSGYLNDGRVKILFERHKFYEAMKKRVSADQLAKLVEQYPDLCNPKAGGYEFNEKEYPRFEKACMIDEWAAYYATSFGLFQICGFNYKDMGYNDPITYGKEAGISESKQLSQFCDFLLNYQGGAALRSLRKGDWADFAYRYNGANYKVNKYDVKLPQAFDKFSKNIWAV